MALPTLMCLKSCYNDKYLRYRYQVDKAHSAVQFSGDNVMDPYAQFEVEKAKTRDGLVHIKSRYTNLYLVRWDPRVYWMSASAYAPDEDESSWKCTLFRPIVVEGSRIRLVHVQLGVHLSIWNVDAPWGPGLIAGDTYNNDKPEGVFEVVDWQSLFRLPRRVAFKGDNGLYLGVAELETGKQGLQFSYQDPNDPKVAQEIFPSPDGTIYIKSEYSGKFWRFGDENWIWADADDPHSTNRNAPRADDEGDGYWTDEEVPPRGTNDPNVMFKLLVLDLNVVALRNMRTNNWFCKRLTDKGLESFMSCYAESIDGFAKLEVKDLGTKDEAY